MVAWPEDVNQKAYGMNTEYEDNLVKIQFDSGKERTYLKNSSSEYKKFLNWFENVCLSGSQSFAFPNLITHSGNAEYKFTDTPSARGQKYKEVSFSVIEM